MALPEMAAGGAWLSCSPDQQPIYVVGDDTITRLLHSGYQVVADPRLEPAPSLAPEVESASPPTPEAAKEESETIV